MLRLRRLLLLSLRAAFQTPETMNFLVINFSWLETSEMEPIFGDGVRGRGEERITPDTGCGITRQIRGPVAVQLRAAGVLVIHILAERRFVCVWSMSPRRLVHSAHQPDQTLSVLICVVTVARRIMEATWDASSEDHLWGCAPRVSAQIRSQLSYDVPVSDSKQRLHLNVLFPAL